VKHYLSPLFIFLLTLAISACDDPNSKTGNNANNINNINNINNVNNINNTNNTNYTTTSNICGEVDATDEYTWTEDEERAITLGGTSVSAGAGVTVNGTTATITQGGVYRVSGTLTDGRILVDAAADALVVLILDGVTLTSATDAPLVATSAGKVILHVPTGTTSTLTDAATRPSTTSPNAAIHVSGDLALDGGGTLVVHGRYNDGLRGMRGLAVHGGTFTVDGRDDALVAEDCVIVHAGTFNLQTTSGDALKAENSVDVDLGYVHVLGGDFTIRAASDGLQAETDLMITAGTFDVTCAGGATGTVNDALSAKAFKAGTDLTVVGGDFQVSSADDAFHSNTGMTIEDGAFTIATSDDAFHAETTLLIAGGDVTVTACYEAVEAVNITISGGTLHLRSSDDSLNAAGDATPRSLTISGGYLAITADGDGVDANGNITMSAGTVIVHGPTRNDNGAIDCDGTFRLTGGFLVAAGSSGMAEAPDTVSSQYSVLWGHNTAVPAGTLIHLRTSTGTELLTFQSTKAVQSVCFSSPGFVAGSYAIYTGGSYSPGGEADGVYSGGTYTPGTQFRTFTASSAVTKVNISGGPPGGK